MPIKLKKNNKAELEKHFERKGIKKHNNVYVMRDDNFELYKNIINNIQSCRDDEVVIYRKIPVRFKNRIETMIDAVLGAY